MKHRTLLTTITVHILRYTSGHFNHYILDKSYQILHIKKGSGMLCTVYHQVVPVFK